jgi:hypothetical protein
MLRRAFLVALSCTALLVPATASTLEDASSGAVSYQYDAGTYRDAPDGCDSADPTWTLPFGSSVDGLLAPPDDVRDAYVLEVPQSLVGSRLQLTAEEPTEGAQALAVDAYVPGCMGSILDMVNWPTPEPSPPAPAAGEKQVSPDLQPRYCEPNHWVFLIEGLEGFAAPASIYVAWTDGTEKPLPLRWSNHRSAVYVTQENLDITLKGAWANLPAAWAGSFSLFLGPCGTRDGGAVYGDAPTVDLGALEFTPTKAGPYVVLVSWQGGAVPSADPPASVDPSPLFPVDPHEAFHDPAGAAEDVAGFLANPPPPQDLLPIVSAPRSCHFCLGPVENLAGRVMYVLSAGKA